MAKKLLLFDIDGTLVRSNGAGRETMVWALTKLFGTAGPIDSYSMDGKTDPRIVTDLLTAAGIPDGRIAESLPQVFALMAEKAKSVFPVRNLAPCPGIVDLLARLQTEKSVTLGLLTGNSELTAPLKLLYAGLDPTIFSVGAYGSDHIDRNQLPAIAMQRATEQTGILFSGEETIIIGDTPADILCARAGQATAVAVASGWHSAATLAKYHPDHLFENLADTPAVLRTLLGIEMTL